jgi:ABC-type lipoprotein export system ATPase subunit
MSDAAIGVCDLEKSYRMGRTNLHVLGGLSFQVKVGEFVAIVGASGSGKSTLLHLIGLLDRPDVGRVSLAGVDTGGLSGGQRNRIRCRDIGFVFQFYHLLPELNVLENVLLPAKVRASTLGWLARKKAARRRAEMLLDQLALKDRLRHRPKELSGGEMQRVAIARALINQPKVLLADEPTGNLDSKTGMRIMHVLQRFHRDLGQTILMVTHDSSLADQADRLLHLRDGRLT